MFMADALWVVAMAHSMNREGKMSRMNNDTISRQAAIDAVSRGCQEFRGIFAECEKNLKALPSAEMLAYREGYEQGKKDAERRGRWVAVENDVDYYPFMCSECYETVIKRTNYCPRCGAKMEAEE